MFSHKLAACIGTGSAARVLSAVVRPRVLPCRVLRGGRTAASGRDAANGGPAAGEAAAALAPQAATRVPAQNGRVDATGGLAVVAKATPADAELPEDGDIPPEVEELFQTLRAEALRRLDEFGPIHLFSMCWAYSTARLLDADLQQAITDRALHLGRQRDEDAAKRRGADLPAPDSELKLPERTTSGDLHEQPSLLAQGPHWLALYKPPFWQVSVDSKEAAKAAATAPFEDDDDGDGDGDEQQAEQTRKRPRLQYWLKQNIAAEYPICSDPIEAFGLLHRLDQQTSGLLMCAKSYVGAYWLRLQWCSYNVHKEYVCLVHGWVDPSIREVHKRIRVDKKKAENSRRTISTKCSVSDSGKPSYTELFTLAHLTRTSVEGRNDQSESQGGGERYSLVSVKLHTGRTHQIRVHMLSLGHPLVTDSKYAEDYHDADQLWCPRNFLHTYRLSFDDVPAQDGQGVRQKSGENVDVYCPLPPDLRESLATLKPEGDVARTHYDAWLSGDSKRLASFEEYVADAADLQNNSEKSC